MEIHQTTLDEAAAACGSWMREKPAAARVVVTVNPEIVVQCKRHPRLAAAVARADLAVADGIGVVYASRILGSSLPERVAGIDLMESLLDFAGINGMRAYFLGGRPGVAEEAARAAVSRFPGLGVAGHHHGYFSREEETSVVKRIREVAPDLLIVGMGAPRQEIFMVSHKDDLGAGVAIGVGGALDALSGRTRRAPRWVRRSNLEWLYRLMREPRRVTRQAKLVSFALMVAMEAARRRLWGDRPL